MKRLIRGCDLNRLPPAHHHAPQLLRILQPFLKIRLQIARQAQVWTCPEFQWPFLVIGFAPLATLRVAMLAGKAGLALGGC